MPIGNFSFLLLIIGGFAFTAFVSPFVSLAFHQNERRRNFEVLRQTPLVRVFLIEVLLWVVLILVLGFGLLMMSSMVVMANAHSDADPRAPTPIAAILLAIGGEALLVGAAYALHTRASDKLWSFSRRNRTSA